MSFLSSLQADPEMQERFAEYAFSEAERNNDKILDFSDFVEYFTQAFSGGQGENILKNFNDEESRLLWESPAVQARIVREGYEEDNLQDIMDTSQEFEVQRDKPKGQVILPEEIRVIRVERKELEVRRGDVVYKRASPMRFTAQQTRFLDVRKTNGVSRIETIKQYNEHFKQEQRSEKSISSKFYRMK